MVQPALAEDDILPSCRIFLTKKLQVHYYSALFSFQGQQTISAEDWLHDLLIKSLSILN